MVTLQLRQLDVPPGQRLLIRNLDWQQFERILAELGESRSARIAYSRGTLEIRMPTPEHEVDKELIGDLVKILLDELEIDCECFGSTTFKQEAMQSGIEPDQCFYIQNQAQMRGKRRINLTVDPPPDLAIEVDVTSKTQLDAYAALGVPELWRYEKQLSIYVLRAGQYQLVNVSPTFPTLPILGLVAELLEQSSLLGRSPALRALRRRIQALR
ncbi:Uma2 family endonuclease [Romeria aff. gracilis LEGE 07310]|uniref:Uma2 family endonuclease n=1 Tax=Vasconcelosia minhoensis LEGE 07310 TaxID=915328 RepID=A0A8J7DNQ1_9CYAN|nr:Uma2 family endonuclease [Romeria gracilis]MBE9078425.1 Uma2 family endonuclease [Romeria aff. gracilis LEGE 07310]